MKKPYALIILDGYGTSDGDYNAITANGSKNIQSLKKRFPHCSLQADGYAVGLPKGQMGNSEVGHLTIGAGKAVFQSLTQINLAIEDGSFFSNKIILQAMQNAKDNGTNLHIMGLVSDGGVHSHINHIFAVLDTAKQQELSKVFVHCLTDGRDTPVTNGAGYVEQLQNYMSKIGVGKIATVGGRYYAMDRDGNYDRVKLGYDAMVFGRGDFYSDAKKVFEHSYKNNITDEFIKPSVITQGGKPTAVVENGDSIIAVNFRPDRMRQITAALTQQSFDKFQTKKMEIYFCAFGVYDLVFEGVHTAFKPDVLEMTLGKYLSQQGLMQARIAETEKYAHVTFFFNGGDEVPNQNEDRILLASPKVATYDLMPEMSAYLVRDKVLQCINDGKYDCYIINFANCDMVGHTGNFDATVKAVGVVDECVGDVVNRILDLGGSCIVTADHGNAEMMQHNGQQHTAHTNSRVPLILCSQQFADSKLADGGLCDVAPTLLEVIGLPKPTQMNGNSLIINKQ